MSAALPCTLLLVFLTTARAIAGSADMPGTLLLHPTDDTSLEVLRDDYGSAESAALRLAQLPAMELEVVLAGQDIVPLRQGPQATGHPYWDIVVHPGTLEPAGDDATSRRLRLPLSLQEVDANCLHNGLLQATLQDDGHFSHGTLEISSETCQYLKFDLQARFELQFQRRETPFSEDPAARFRAHRQARLPLAPLAALATAYPSVNTQAFRGGTRIDARHITTSGFVIDDRHYSSGCPTRAGADLPCESLSLPSYSLAKSLVAGLGLMRLEQLYPGSTQHLVSELLPACADWGEIRVVDALDMVTGRYRSSHHEEDESSPEMVRGFFLPPAHRDKLAFACSAWPRRGPPGDRWVYHTSDTYVVGAAINRLLRQQRGPDADFYRDLLLPLWQQLRLSPALDDTRRTRDPALQPYTGWGLTLLPDDLARLGVALNRGELAGSLDTGMLQDVFDAGRGGAAPLATPLPGQGYRHGFWLYDATALLDCPAPLWVPYLSGYGGINLVAMPNDTVYYIVSDGGEFDLAPALLESHRLRPMC